MNIFHILWIWTRIQTLGNTWRRETRLINASGWWNDSLSLKCDPPQTFCKRVFHCSHWKKDEISLRMIKTNEATMSRSQWKTVKGTSISWGVSTCFKWIFSRHTRHKIGSNELNFSQGMTSVTNLKKIVSFKRKKKRKEGDLRCWTQLRFIVTVVVPDGFVDFASNVRSSCHGQENYF